MAFEKFYNSMTRRRTAGIADCAYVGGKNVIALAEGKTSLEILPIDEVKFHVKNLGYLSFDFAEMNEAFGLGQAKGCSVFLEIVKEMQQKFHRPAIRDWDIIVTNGAQDGLYKSIESFIKEGDPVMIQSPTYYLLIGILAPYDAEFIGIDQDEDGIIPEIIEKVCEEKLRAGKPLPKVLYVNPTGANPTGTVLTECRRRKVYELARKYDFLIVEDDPYYFLTFHNQRPTSFFELDTDGRVIRLDSFSKILSAGLRLGVVTAHKSLISKLMLHVESSTMHASSLSQMLLYKLLDTWGLQKFEDHIQEVANLYKNRRDIMLDSLDRHFKGLAKWNVPNGGMFVWVTIPGIEDVFELTTKKCVPAGVFVLPGHAFNYDSAKKSQNIRLCYSYASPEEIDKALSIMAKLIREELTINGK